MLFLSYVIAQ